MLDINTTTSI